MKLAKLQKLRRKAYRSAYVKSHLEQGIAAQIRALRLGAGLTQAQLAKQLGLKNQSLVSRWEDASYGRVTLPTLLKISDHFDVAFMAKFVPYSRFLREVEDVSEASLAVENFVDEDRNGAIEYAPELQVRRISGSQPLISRESLPGLNAIFVAPFQVGAQPEGQASSSFLDIKYHAEDYSF